MCRPLREQAHSHPGCGQTQLSSPPSFPSGSGLAREGVRSGNTDVECAAPFVSKPTSTLTVARHKSRPHRHSLVGAGLLAKASGQATSMLNVPPLREQAHSHPDCGQTQISSLPSFPCGSGLAREGVRSGNSDVECACPLREQAHFHPDCGQTQISSPPSFPCGSGLAREGIRSGNSDVECACLFVSKPTPSYDRRCFWGLFTEHQTSQSSKSPHRFSGRSRKRRPVPCIAGSSGWRSGRGWRASHR
ncbi:hypothetical protein ATI02_1390 [Pseudomonas baetica]|uniref:Uncharacterized protein n=1 Tax=Pseudomonas baetica TaxID=674054 RepID=A0ABX4PUH5_9PSED|nr:hypothetical protein ATI02_1390 [Pseudomonas baetica]